MELFGVWKYQQRLVDGVDKLDDCQRESTSNIKSDGTFESTFYLETNGECKVDNRFKVIGKDVIIVLINENK